MDTSFNVVCLKWGDKYSAEYVNNLYSMVKRHLALPHRFVCLTDDSTGVDPKVECKELLDENLKGWWNKLSMFKEEIHDLKGTVLFLDLDIVIINNIDYIFKYKEEEKMLGVKDFIYPNKEFNSSVLRFELGEWKSIYQRFESELTLQPDGHYQTLGKTFIGDQQWITYCAYPDGTHKHHAYPDGKIVSYKRDIQHRDALPPEASIVVFHGYPNPHEVDKGWVKDNWK